MTESLVTLVLVFTILVAFVTLVVLAPDKPR
jgi:hypothetical protein